MEKLYRLLPVLASVILLVSCATKVNSLQEDVDINLDPDEGYLMFTVDTSSNLHKIRISGEKNVVITSKDLKRGKNTILLPMPAGEYHFDRIHFRTFFSERFLELVPEHWRFTTSAGKISYVGHLKLENPLFGNEASFFLVNKASEAIEYLEQNFSAILNKREVDYQGPGEDGFMAFVKNGKEATQAAGNVTPIDMCQLPKCTEKNLQFKQRGSFIDPEKLFMDFQTQKVIFSPDGKRVLGLFILGNEKKMVLVNIEKFTQSEIFKLTKKNSTIDSFSWMDDDTLLIKYTTNGSNVTSFINLSWEQEKLKSKLSQARFKGTIVDPLEQRDDEVLFSKLIVNDDGEPRSILYRLSPNNLVRKVYPNASRLPNQLPGAILYLADQSKQMLMGMTRENERVLFWRRGYEQTEWQSMGEIGTSDNEFRPVGFINDNTLAVLSDERSDLTALVEYDLSKKQYGNVLFKHERYDIYDARMSGDGKKIKFVQFIEHGRMVTQYFSADDIAVKAIVDNEFTEHQKQFYIVDEDAKTGNKLLYIYGAAEPGGYYLFQNERKILARIGNTLPVFDDLSIVAPEVFSVSVEDGVEVEAILSKPGDNANGVLLVMPHGGPIGVQTTSEFSREVSFFTDRGYAVLEVNFRGSSGYGKQFMAQGVGQFGRLIEHDIAKAVKEAKKRYDYNLMCSIGTSYGGYSALMLALKKPEDYQCVIAMYGIYDLPLTFNSANFEQIEEFQQAIERVLGENKAELGEVSPLYLLEQLQTPLLLVAGIDDEVAWFEQSSRLKYRLQQLDKPFEYLFYKNVGHAHHTFRGERHQVAYIDDFIRRQLKLPLTVSEENRAILVRENLLLAKTFDSDAYLKRDEKRAVYYYRQAALLGHNESIHKLGIAFQRGIGVGLNLDKAVQWYKKAANSGHVPAEIQLGEIYRDTNYKNRDLEMSYKMFQSAQQQGDKSAYLYIARAQCLGEGVSQNLNACVKGLGKPIKQDRALVAVRDIIIGDMFWHENLSVKVNEALKQLLREMNYVDIFEPDVEVDNWGIFVKPTLQDYDMVKRKYTFAQRHLRTDKIIPIGKNGIAFGVKLSNEDVEPNSTIALKVRWQTPLTGNLSGLASMRDIKLYKIIPASDRSFKFFFYLDKPTKMVKGRWSLEVLTLDNRLIFKQDFITQ